MEMEVDSYVRDIRNDLRERLADLDRKQAQQTSHYQSEILRIEDEHRSAIKAIEMERAALKQLLSIEDQRSATSTNFTMRSDPSIPLAEFLIAKVRMCGQMEKEELRAAADEAGYTDGRTFHATLMNITKGGRLQQFKDGRYSIPSINDQTLFDGRSLGVSPDEMRRFGIIPKHAKVIGEEPPSTPGAIDESGFN